MAIQDYTVAGLYDLSQTIAADLFKDVTYPWEALAGISDFIIELGRTLPEDRFEKRGENVWVAKSAKVFDSAYIVVGKKAVVGNSTELKNVVLFDQVQVPHYNYVGDSILGVHAHMGAGSITSNVKADNKAVVIHDGDEHMETGRRKIGAMLGDYADIGCNTVLNPGTVVGRHTNIYPVSMVRGCVPAHSIYKDRDHIVPKRDE